MYCMFAICRSCISAPSPYILGAALEEHLERYESLMTLNQEAIADSKEKVYGKESNKNDTALAKLSIGTKAYDTQPLGIPWNKNKDEITINIEKITKNINSTVATKKNIMSDINSIFDALGLGHQ